MGQAKTKPPSESDAASRRFLDLRSPAAEIAETLLRDCPRAARIFSVAMHETACEAGDEHHAALWERVLALL
jgi:hypothetical protein